MEGRCARASECAFFAKHQECFGCGFQHFPRVVPGSVPQSRHLQTLSEDYFRRCSTREGKGGRITVDSSLKALLSKELDGLLHPERPEFEHTILIHNEPVRFRIKCDAAYRLRNDHHIFIEMKGYGDDTNGVLSAIMAAQFAKMALASKSHFFIIGVSAAGRQDGILSSDYLNERHIGLSPYCRWAEARDYARFFGIREIRDVIEEIKLVASPAG